MLSGAERLVASFTDAWIETTGEIDLSPEELSHLLQMRGLKLIVLHLMMVDTRSHLLQMRGLKHSSSRPRQRL